MLYLSRFPPLHLLFSVLKQSKSTKRPCLRFNSSFFFLLISLPTTAHSIKPFFLSLSLFSFLSSVSQLVTTWTRCNATSSCSHLEVSAVPETHSLGLILLYSQQLCVFPLYLPPPIFWPHLFLVPAGSVGIWKKKRPVLSRWDSNPNGCWETLRHCG